MAPQHPRRLLLLSIPRSGSHLLVRMLNLDAQPNLSARAFGGYHFQTFLEIFYEKLKLHEKPRIADWTDDERHDVWKMLQDAFDEWDSAAQNAGIKGNSYFSKEHICWMLDPAAWEQYFIGTSDLNTERQPWTLRVPVTYGQNLTHSLGNITPIPDEVLREWSPTFLIRHPALAFPSLKRAAGWSSTLCQGHDTLRFSRTLYDFYVNQFKQHTPAGVPGKERHYWPLVLDADDVISNPAVLERWCELSGLDKSKLQFQWAPVTKQQFATLPLVVQKMAVSLYESSGAIRSKMSDGLDLDAVCAGFTEEFGEAEGQQMEKMVRDAMADYDYLRSRRLQL